MIETDLVVQPGRDQGEHQGEDVDDDGDAAGSEHEHLLNLDPFELCDVVPVVTDQGVGVHYTRIGPIVKQVYGRIKTQRGIKVCRQCFLYYKHTSKALRLLQLKAFNEIKEIILLSRKR